MGITRRPCVDPTGIYLVTNFNVCSPCQNRALLQKSPIFVGLVCKRALFLQERPDPFVEILEAVVFAREHYFHGALLQKSPIFVGRFA